VTSTERDIRTPADLYLELLAATLTRSLFEDNDWVVGLSAHWGPVPPLLRAAGYIAPALDKLGFELVARRPFDRASREVGADWPARAETMVGLKRLANVRHCIESVLDDGVPGDLVETGVWRGGTSIFMRGVLAAYGAKDRTVWLADSFQGLPPPDPARFPADENLDFSGNKYLAAGVDTVKRNFERYGLLDDQVEFVVGWFRDTLSGAPIEQIAVLRLDGDLYESTMEALDPLYPKLAIGGYCIVDDFGTIEACASAVNDYRARHNITDEIIDVDGRGVYWRKTRQDNVE
jgi:O-methyltransferase